MSAFTEVPCPACKAPAGKPCNRHGRVLDDAHPAREDASRDAFLTANGWPALGKGARTT